MGKHTERFFGHKLSKSEIRIKAIISEIEEKSKGEVGLEETEQLKHFLWKNAADYKTSKEGRIAVRTLQQMLLNK